MEDSNSIEKTNLMEEIIPIIETFSNLIILKIDKIKDKLQGNNFKSK